MRALTKRRAAFTMLASAAIMGSVAIVGIPAYGQQSAGVTNAGDASASTGGNSSTGNGSTNVASNAASADVPAADPSSPTLVGGLLGLVANLAGGNSANASTGTSAVSTGPAQASGNNSNTAVTQSEADAGGRGGPVFIGGPIVGTVFGPLAAVPAQSAGVSNVGDATASSGGNSGTGNGSSNVASNAQTVNGGLIAIGLNLGGSASNTSSGTSTIQTGAASAAGNTATTGVTQQDVGGFGPGTRFGIGGGAACDGFFGFGGQRVNVTNAGSADASTGGNTSVGNASTNVATNTQEVNGGLIGIGLNLLANNATNASDGASAITTGAASASGNQSTTSVNQQCVELQPVHAAFHGPPSITPHVVRLGVPVVPVAQQQLARTGVDPFVLGLIAFSLLFGGLLFMVWERVESYPTGPTSAA